MSAIIVPRRWTRQPNRQVDIDWTHPLASALDLNSILGVPNRRLSVTGTKISASKLGLARAFGTNVGKASTDIVSLRLANTTLGPRTTLTIYIARSGGTSNFGRIFSRNQLGGSTAAEVVNFCGAGADIAYCRTDGSGTDIADAQATHGAFNEPHTLVTVNDGVNTSSTKIFEDGVQLSTSAVASPVGLTAPLATNYLNFGNFGSGTRAHDGWIGLFLSWNRMLSTAEIREITRNPWQIFKPIGTRIYIDGGSSSFNPAWARNRNTLIQAGMPL